jgi:hypothetical protein
LRLFPSARNSRYAGISRRHRVRSQLSAEGLEPRALLAAEPILSEFLASNQTTLDDDDRESSDWIEIYNRGDEAANLVGWHLTDDADDLSKWTFPDVSVPPGGYLVVFASGKDRADANELHTNFRLSTSGEYVGLVRPDGETIVSEFKSYPEQFTDVSYGLRMGDVEERFVQVGSPAQLLVPSDNALGTQWTTHDFVPDGSWITQKGLGDPVTVGIGFDSSSGFTEHFQTDVESLMRGQNSSIYVRIPFEVTDPGTIRELLLRVKFDDGYLLYLNGHLLDLQNAPFTSSYNSTATGSRPNEAAVVFDEVDLSLYIDRLRAGQNVLALHGLNRSADDDDFLLVPELYTTGISVLDEAPGYFTAPTPGELNLNQFALGPSITNVRHDPPQPGADDALTVTAAVDETLYDLQQVALTYRLMYETEVALPMTDDGQGADAVAGDGVFTAVIPAGVAQPGQMLRYYVTAMDIHNEASRTPRVLDTTGTDRSEEYFGTVIDDPTLADNLPLFHWFTESVPRARGRSGARASVYYDGEFYDNIFVRQRGGATNGASQKFNFGDDHRFRVNDQLGRVAEINMNAQGSDPSFLRQSLAFETFAWAGNETSSSFLIQMRVNGSEDRIGVFIEQVDENFLARHGLDPDGALYKLVQRSNLNPVFADTTTGVEKKTRLDEDFSDLQHVVDGLTRPTAPERALAVFDNFNVAQVLNYLAVRSVIMDADDVRKNFYVYRDTQGTGQWSIFPWDKDWTFGVVGDGGPHLEHPFFGDEAHLKTNANQWNRLYDAIFTDPVLSEMYLRRLRTVMDLVLQPPGTVAEQGRFEQRIDAMLAEAGDLLSRGAIDQVERALKNFFPDRRSTLYTDHSIDQLGQGELRDIIAEYTENVQYWVPTDNSLGTGWTGLTDPANIAQWSTGQTGFGFGDRFDELVRTTVNPRDKCTECTSLLVRIPFQIDIASQIEQLTLRMKYDDGFVAYLNGTEVVRARVDGTPTYDASASTHSNTAAVQFENFNISASAHLLQDGQNMLAIHAINSSPTSNDMLLMPALIEGIVGSPNAAGIPHAQIGNPAIEFGAFDYDPASGNQDEEYIELRNPLDTAVDISHWQLSGGIEHRFPAGTVIPAGGSLFATPDVAAFLARQTGPRGGEGRFVQGNYQGHLSNLGERIELIAADGANIATLTTPVTPTLAQQFLRVSELHYNPPGPDDSTEFIELLNISSGERASVLDLGGVAISDGGAELYRIPAGTTLSAGEFLVVAKDPAALSAARPELDARRVMGPLVGGLNNRGETLTLDDARGSTILSFAYSDSAMWPRRADGDGSSLEVVDPVNTPVELLDKPASWRASVDIAGSPGRASTPQLGVVINEVLANPAAQGAQDAIELLNRSSQTIDLSGWYLSDSADEFRKFALPPGTLLAPGQYLVVTEEQFNDPQTSLVPFGLSDEGDQVWLVAPHRVTGEVAYFADDLQLGATTEGETWGRVPNGEGVFAPLRSSTFGRANSDPRAGGIAMTELQYHPAAPSSAALAAFPTLTQRDLEFLEIQNATDARVELAGWQLDGTIEFEFGDAAELGTGQTLVVVSFDPTDIDNRGRLRAFRLHYGLDESVRLVGGYAGGLNDGYGRVTLLRPGAPLEDDPSRHVQLIEDEVRYDDRSPWPTNADGNGASLTRASWDAFGNAAASWRGLPPSPGYLAAVSGDLNLDGQVDGADLDALCAGINQGDGQFDWDGDGSVNENDMSFFIFDILRTTVGDANVDRIFNSSDLVLVFQAGEYEDAIDRNSTWNEGDWNCDGEFSSRDVVIAFQSGDYVHASVRGDALSLDPSEPVRISWTAAVPAEGLDKGRTQPNEFRPGRSSVEQPVMRQDYVRLLPPEERIFAEDLLEFGYAARRAAQALKELGHEPDVFGPHLGQSRLGFERQAVIPA